MALYANPFLEEEWLGQAAVNPVPQDIYAYPGYTQPLDPSQFASPPAMGGPIPSNIYAPTQYTQPLDPAQFVSPQAYQPSAFYGGGMQPGDFDPQDMYAWQPEQFEGGQGPTYIADLLKAMARGDFESQPSEFARIFREQYPQDQYPLGPRQPEGGVFMEPIPWLEPYEQAAGEIGRAAGRLFPYATGIGAGADLIFGGGTAGRAGGGVGESVGQSLFPNAWDAILAELLPGISTTRGALSFGRQAAREGLEAAMQSALGAGVRTGISNLGENIPEALRAGERGALNLPGAGGADELVEAIARGTPPPAGEEGFAANIRLSKYPEDLRSTIKEWADANPEAVQAARRGVIPDAEVLENARQLVEETGGDFAKVQRRWKSGEAWNAEEITAIRGTLRAKTDAVLEAANATKLENSATNHARLLVALQEQARVQEIVHGVTAEAGRALRAFRQEAFDAINASDNVRLENLLRRVGDRSKLDDVAAAVARLDLENPAAVNNFLRDISKPTLWDYVMEVWINSILSGPKTHIINSLSNTMNMFFSPVERGIAAGVENVLAPLQRRQVERFLAEVPADAFGSLQGLPEGIRAALSTIKNGITPAQASKWEFRKTAFKGTLGRIIRAPGTALEAADSMNYAINYRSALNASIVRQARKEGLSGSGLLNRIADLKANPTAALIKQASETAEYRLFRQEPGEITATLMQLRDKLPPLRFVIPFLRTPVNLLKFGLERSPAGLLNPSLWRNLAAKSPEASDQIARAFLGSTIAAGVAYQFGQGAITGAAPEGEAARDRFFREGKLPFAVKIGDRWIQYQRLEPFNQVLSQVAGAIEAIQSGKDAVGMVQEAVVTIGQNLVSQTYLSSLNSLLAALTDPDRYAESFLTRFATGLVPASSALRTAAQMTDQTIRQPESLSESIRATIPGLSQTVPPRLTAFGEEAQRQSPAWSPIQVTAEKQSAVDAELGRISVEIGFVGDSIGGQALTREQQQIYQQAAGQAVYQVLQRLIESSAYRALSDVQKEKAIIRARDLARDAVRESLSKEWWPE